MGLLTQIEVEELMYAGGIARAEASMNGAEERGAADQNPYAKEILRDFVLPIAAVIKNDLAQRRAGRQQAHVLLLRPLDVEAVAFLAVRSALNHCMSTKESNERSVGYAVGAAIHAELALAQIEAFNPELYYTLDRDLTSRKSKNERHRMTVFKMQAKKAGIDIVEWPIGAREQVGMYLLGLLEQAGMIEIGPLVLKNQKRTWRAISLSFDLLERVGQIKAYVAITAPAYGPCVEKPMDWLTSTGGGFHTAKLRRLRPFFVSCHSSVRDLYRREQPPIVLSAINAMQGTAWKINEGILKVIMTMAEHGIHTKEVVALIDKPKPPPPGWLSKEMTNETMTEAQLKEFRDWKSLLTDWYTDKKLMGSRYGRFYGATRTAMTFRDYPELFFVYFADSRGRMYPMTTGVNPQGSDLQKALLMFAKGKPLHTPEALRWFHIQGANKWGFDKATLSERFMWAHEREEWLLHLAADPINNQEWLDAGDPFQFLAWVMEYAEWKASPETFVSRLPISMDGSCNGLQNLSAMLRDEVGGKATNLTANVVMEDIYKRVAEAAMVRLMILPAQDELSAKLIGLWITHGISRKVVKRSVMTTPYGVTHRSATDYVITDYLKEHDNPFDKTEYRKAATLLMSVVWPAIGDVVVKGRECMEWLRKASRQIVHEMDEHEEPIIWWRSPSGFIASQAYFEFEEHRINTRLAGAAKIRVVSETDEPDLLRHASGLAPNFVHSMDAAHLHRVAAAASADGQITHLAMIHDDYGTHAADAQRLYELIRSEFVTMYEEHDPVLDFAAKYPTIPAPPTKGTLNIREVLESPFFFS